MMPTFHFHKLSGNMDGFFAIDVKTRRDPWRIIIQPLDENEEPYDPCNIDEIAGVVRIVEVKEVSKHYYDMILMDVQMPVMNGYEATKAIRRSSHELAKKIPIIAMTANAFSEDIQHSLAAGMNAHVSKPVEMRVLEKTIRSIKTGGGRNSRH